MKKMKKAILPLLCMMMLFCAAITAHAAEEISAEAENNASTWSISGISIDHRSLVFTVSDVDHAQDAVAVIETSDGEDPIELPFSIKNTVDKISLTFPDGSWLPTGSYLISIRDESGNSSSSYRSSVADHSTRFAIAYGHAYPSLMTGEDRYNCITHIVAIVGFQEYEALKNSSGNFTIQYPKQEPGTVIQVECRDDYGCCEVSKYTVEDQYVPAPTVIAFRDSIALKGSNGIDNDDRLCAEVDGTVYYADYGLDGRYSGMIVPAISYPPVVGDTVTVWTENICGSISKKVKYPISDCALDQCSYRNLNNPVYKEGTYPSKTFGRVLANIHGQVPVTVSTTINGVLYTADIDPDSGQYTLSYPTQPRESYLTLTYTDIHGCTYARRVSVTNSLKYKYDGHDLYRSGYQGHFFPTHFTETLSSGSRIVAEVNGKIYKSATASDEIPTVTVQYPQQTVGSKLTAWIESENSSFTDRYQYTVFDPYELNVEAKTTSIGGGIFLNREYYSYYYKEPGKTAPSVYVEISGKRYPCTLTKPSYKDEKKYGYVEDSDKYLSSTHLMDYKFQCSYPPVDPYDNIKLVVTDKYNYTITKTIEVQNTPPKLKVQKVTSSTTKVTGSTSAKYGSLVEVFTDKKTYKAKVRGDGTFSVKIKSQKPGTSIDVMVTTKDGNYNYKSLKIKQGKSSVTIRGTLYSSKSSVQVTLGSARKGDKLRLKVGSKTYTKKIKSGKKRQTITFPLSPKAAAGSTVKTVLYDKFGKKKGSDERRVYIGNTIYTGMSANDALLTTWGRPVRRNDWGNGYLQWVFVSGRTTLYVYIQNSRVVSLQKYNY